MPDASGIDPAYHWLFDADAWKPIDNVPACDMRLADLNKVAYPGHNWMDCGPGCRRAEVMPGSGVLYRGAARHATGARPQGPDIRVNMVSGVRFPPGLQLAESFSLSTDEPSWLMALHGDTCELAFNGRASSRMFVAYRFQQSGGDGTRWFGLAPQVPGQPAVWALPPVKTTAYNMLDFTGGWGAIISQTSFAYTLDVTSTELTSVFSSPAYQLQPRAAGDAVIWVDWTAGNAAIRGWTVQGGSRLLAQGPWDAVGADISDTRLVWIAATGPQTVSGAYETAQLYWSPRKLDPDQLEVKSSVELPTYIDAVGLRTGGRWAAFNVGVGDELGVLIADLDANELWEIPPKAGHWPGVLAISETELLIGDDVTSGVKASQYLDELVRYDLPKISQFAQKVP